MSENTVTCEMVIEKLDALIYEANKMKRAVMAVSEGIPFTEAFNEELFTEEADRRDIASSKLARFMQHLLKAKYSTIETYREEWKDEARKKFRNQVIDEILWGSKKPYTNGINYLQDNLQDIYENSIKLYKISAKDYKDLVPGIKYIPEECPWETLEELMEDAIDDLLEELPDPDYY